MHKILADHDVEGQVEEIVLILTSPDWFDLWHLVDVQVFTFDGIGLPENASDADVWKFCQDQQMVLITGNRNADGENSLEQTIQRENNTKCLPVLTIGDPKRVMFDHEYALQVASKILDYVFDIERFRGSRRLYVP